VASAVLLIARVGIADVQNVLLAFCFNGIGVPVAATGLIDPI
jgi:cation transport ATPase